MPAKYRRMGDYHEYYSGAKIAPYLTVFVGGNHEASNHLSELYYGGWVAPNIYYMGAANVLRLGPLRIAGLSGIWKGYDYRKQHFERLPYNRDDTNSIYHVRELDVRKLLSVRTQVDIGISHDWPQGVEWLGDYNHLFKLKDLFEADANVGKLGSIAAKQCLARLRPPHWFSAHLHVKYPAVVRHPDYEQMSIPPRPNEKPPLLGIPENEIMSIPPRSYEKATVRRDSENKDLSVSSSQNTKAPVIRAGDRQKVSAWSQFHRQAQKEDAEEDERALKEYQNLRELRGGTEIHSKPNYVFKETFKQVKTDDNLGRAVTHIAHEERHQDNAPDIPQIDGQIDGCCPLILPRSLKRARQESSPAESRRASISEDEKAVPARRVDLDGNLRTTETITRSKPATAPIRNTDDIDLNMDSDEEPVNSTNDISVLSKTNTTEASKDERIASGATNPEAIEVDISDEEEPVEDCNLVKIAPNSPAVATSTFKSQNKPRSRSQQQLDGNLSSDLSEDGGMRLNPAAPSFQPRASIASTVQSGQQVPRFRSTSDQSMEGLDLTKVPTVDGREVNSGNAVTDDMRAKLAALNSSFAKPEQVETSPKLPFPEDIRNTSTRFLALDKCERKRHFLELIEIDTATDEKGTGQTQPYKLQYDPEWLAILRVFAPELQFGGDPSDRVPPHRGDTYYRQRIIEEEEYIKKYVVEANLLGVPDNFSITAPVYDPKVHVDHRDMPREVTNAQTSVFCKLIGIENRFDITEEERNARIARGARPDQPRFGGSRNGHGRGSSGSNNRGGGGRGGHRGGRGGRGRGRGRY